MRNIKANFETLQRKVFNTQSKNITNFAIIFLSPVLLCYHIGAVASPHAFLCPIISSLEQSDSVLDLVTGKDHFLKGGRQRRK